MKLQKLKGIIREKGKNYKQCANVIGKSVVSFTRRMNGEIEFSIFELEDLGNFLGMTDDEKIETFLRRIGFNNSQLERGEIKRVT